MRTVRLRRSIAAAALTTVVLSACSLGPAGDDFLEQGPRSMAKTAFADTRKVTSLRILGTMVHDELGPTRLDISLGEAGCTARFTADKGVVSILKNAEGAWLQADRRYWRSEADTPAQARLLESYSRSWIAVEDDDEFAKMCELDVYLKSFKVDKGDTNDPITAEDVEEIGGTDAVPLEGRAKKERTTVWVAVDAPHRVLKMAPTRPGGVPEELLFSNFGAPVDVESPSKTDIVTIPGL